MDWYYAVENQQLGPVGEDDVARLASDGTITGETLVWHEGMEEWRPYAQVQADPTAAAAAPEAAAAGAPVTVGRDANCGECGKLFPTHDMVQIAGAWVCAACKPIAVQKVKEGIAPDTAVQYAGFWIRLVAKFADGFILAVPNLMVVLLVEGLAKLVFGRSNPTVATVLGLLVRTILQIGIGAAYTTFFIGRFAATPGKMACGLKVVMADGGKVTYARALARNFAEMLSGLPTLMIGYIIAAFDREKRALHDHICSTRVVKK